MSIDQGQAEQWLRDDVTEAARFALGDGLTRSHVSMILVEMAQAIETQDDIEMPPIDRTRGAELIRQELGMAPIASADDSFPTTEEP
jgi:hypothetical protein